MLRLSVFTRLPLGLVLWSRYLLLLLLFIRLLGFSDLLLDRLDSLLHSRHVLVALAKLHDQEGE